MINPEALVPDFITYIEIRQAIVRRDFFLEYQPKVSLRSGLIEGVEALVRWQHGKHGRMAPDLFLPDMERTALMSRFTAHVLDAAVAQCAAFHQAGVLLGVAVNVSPSAITPELPSQVRRTLQQHNLEPNWLTLEVTQTIGFENLGRGSAVLNALRAAGVHLSLDDFGTGYATLAHVQALPIDEIKIDRSFVSRATSSSRDAEIVRFAAELAKALKLRVVAEGVEDVPTVALLQACHVDAAQGYYLAPPLSPADLLSQYHEIASKARALAFSAPMDLRDADEHKGRHGVNRGTAPRSGEA